jgi:predicted helicase
MAIVEPKGTIYIRDNELCRLKNIYKLGIASSAKNRDDTYNTYEHERGEFILIIQIHLPIMRVLDIMLKIHLHNYNNYVGGGTEYYNRCIIHLIEPFLQSLNIDYYVLNKGEISLINRCERLRNLPNIKKLKRVFNKMDLKKMIRKYKLKKIEKTITEVLNTMRVKPNSHQQEVLDRIVEFFANNDRGKLIWACGTGKTLLPIFIIQLMKFKLIVIGVFSNYLQQQMKDEILQVFPTKENILFVGSIIDKNSNIKSTTNIEKIISFVNTPSKPNRPKFVIATYHSCHLLVNNHFNFDLKIADEAHHLVGAESNERGFRMFHKIQSIKTLFMTATEKTIEQKRGICGYSMDDESVFGQYIDIKTVQWAIENKKITDYNVLVLKNTEHQVDTIIGSLGINISNREIFISCYMCIISFQKYDNLTHIFLYTNNTQDAEQAQNYLECILSLKKFKSIKDNIYNKALHSNNCYDVDGEIKEFSRTPFGIISCVYLFGEGVNVPRLNAVCIVGNMQSEIRIVQYLLRPNRLDPENPNKIANIIIPYIDSDDFIKSTKSFEKVRIITHHLRNVDENIEQKIKLSIVKIPEIVEGGDEDEATIEMDDRQYRDCYFEETEDELNKIILRLRYSKALNSKNKEELDEYNYVRSINKTLNIQSKKEYIESEKNHCNYIPMPEEYFKLNGVWKDWYDFMGTDTSSFIQSKYDWINFCNNQNIKSLEDYNECCKLYNVLPKEPSDFYQGFTNIMLELGLNKRR